MRQQPIKILVLFILSALLLTCAVKLRIPRPDTLTASQLTSCRQQLHDQYPPAFNLTQRITLTQGKKSYDFIGYLRMASNGNFSAVAAAEMGGTFVALNRRAGKVTISRNPLALPVSPLRDGVAGDILFLFATNSDSGRWSGGWAEETLQLFDQQALRLIRYQLVENKLTDATMWEQDRMVRQAEFKDYRFYPGWSHAVPTVILCANKRWGYNLRIELLDFEPEPGREAEK